MKNVEHLPPTQWAAWAALGSLLMVTPALFALLRLPDFLTHDDGSGAAWPLRLLRLGPSLVGFCMAIVAVTKLRGGVKRNVWTEPELETLRRWTRNPVWVAVSIASFLLGIGIFVADHGSRYGGLFCFLAAPAQILMNLANAANGMVPQRYGRSIGAIRLPGLWADCCWVLKMRR
jgi:hypothetical protein